MGWILCVRTGDHSRTGKIKCDKKKKKSAKVRYTAFVLRPNIVRLLWPQFPCCVAPPVVALPGCVLPCNMPYNIGNGVQTDQMCFNNVEQAGLCLKALLTPNSKFNCDACDPEGQSTPLSV